jgi:hypothetical protein
MAEEQDPDLLAASGHNSGHKAEMRRMIEERINKVLRSDVTLADAANLIIRSNLEVAEKIVQNDHSIHLQEEDFAEARHSQFKDETRKIAGKIDHYVKRTTQMEVVAIGINLLSLIVLVTLIIIFLKFAIIIRE